MQSEKVSHRNETRRIFATFLLLAAILTGPALPGEAQEKPKSDKQKAVLTLLNGLQDAFSAVAEEIEPAVVTVLSSRTTPAADEDEDAQIRRGFAPFRNPSRRATGTGSGVLISRDGWVLTNDHVIGNADKVKIRLHDGREFIGKVVRDRRSDLALVKIESPKSFPVARLGDSDKVKIGHWAIAIGSPYRYEGTFSVGVISSLNRRQEIRDSSSANGIRFYPAMFQTDAAINPGNSGGPLCNIEGEVIAINTAIESDGGGSIGIGFAIPINACKFVVEELMKTGKVRYGYLGVLPASLPPDKAESLKVPYGALVELAPEQNSPAAKAGIRVGDVVTAINSKPVRNEVDLRNIVAQSRPGTTLELLIVRDGEEKTLKALLTDFPDNNADDKPAERKPRLGIEVLALTEAKAREAGVSPKLPGVVIKKIDPGGSAAEVSELAEGMVIQKINERETATVESFRAATAALKTGDRVKIIYTYGRTTRIAIVTID